MLTYLLTLGFALRWPTVLLSSVLAVALHVYAKKTRRIGEAPGPRPWPVLGSLHLMAGYKIPYAAFTAIKAVYGDIFTLHLGSSKCVIVNEPGAVREVLITKGSHFDGRPDFKRFEMLFGGDKQNSLAFCDYTSLQKKRRQILKLYTFPHAHSANWNNLDAVCRDETDRLVDFLKGGKLRGRGEAVVDMKPLILMACANIFNIYFCTAQRFGYEENSFWDYCHNFDEVFWEVNNGRAVDFLPWLMPLMTVTPALQRMRDSSKAVRRFVEGEIIEPKRRTRQDSNETKDILDNLMNYIDSQKKTDGESEMDRESALYALEDILGGHSAVGNIILRILNDLAYQKLGLNTQEKIQMEIESHVSDDDGLSLIHKKNLTWITAAIHETIRLTCSPIVPHVASQNSTIGGYEVEEGTVVIVNNHNLNMSEKLWDEPEVYKPSRFIHPEKGTFTKPDHFQPFSMGRRSCMGYKMVQYIAFSIVANLLQNFTISCSASEQRDLPLGMLALPPTPFYLKIQERDSHY